MFLSLYILALAAFLLLAPIDLLDPANRPFIIVIGIIGAWRYSWALVHFGRAQYYKHWFFPRLRRRADALMAAATAAAAEPADPEEASRASPSQTASPSQPALPSEPASPSQPALVESATDETAPEAIGSLPEIYLLVTSFRQRAEITAVVFRAAIEEACRYQGQVTVVAALVEMADQRFIKQIFYHLGPPERVRLLFVRTPSHGKRHSLAVGLRAIARSRPAPNALVTFLDGDTLLTPGTLERCVPLFEAMPEIGALTTDEDALVHGGSVLQQWYRLRFAQRQMLMCSMGLAGRLLTLTGRMSMFRAAFAVEPSFIENLAADSVDHWRIGRIPLLTGDDKSTWFWLLRRGQTMLYVPDVQVITVEEPPDERFFVASTRQMRRWFGNMLRASTRAIGLGPRQIGLFAWWCLIDQRVSMWTPLLLPLAAAFLSYVVGPVILYAYVGWVLSTRLIQALALLTVRPVIGGLYPLLIFYGQVYGSIIKTWILFHPYQQAWTRQPMPVPGFEDGVGWWQSVVSTYTYIVAILALITLVAFATDLLPPAATLTAAIGNLF